MKKLLSLTLALIMVLTLTVAVAAEDAPYEHDTSVTIGIAFNGANGASATPEETFTYTISEGAMIDGNKVYVTDSSLTDAPGIPMPTLSETSVTTLTPGETGKLVYDLPTYAKVGIYYYTISQTPGQKAGIAYDTSVFVLKVTVIEQNGLVYVAAVHAETASGAKINENNGFVNTYSAGSLSVTKTVDGNLGDRTKYFAFTVTLTGETGKTYETTYTVSGGSKLGNGSDDATTATIAVGTPATFYLKHGETFTIGNLPYNVTYTVEEVAASATGYEVTYSDNKNGSIDAASDTVTVTNTRGTTVDTGVVLDSLPYVLLIAVAVVGVVAFTAKKRIAR